MNRHWWVWLLVGLAGLCVGTQRLLMHMFHGWGPGKYQFAMSAAFFAACVLLALEYRTYTTGERLGHAPHERRPATDNGRGTDAPKGAESTGTN